MSRSDADGTPPDRAEIDDRYTADPSLVFGSPREWEDERDALADAVADLRERAERTERDGPAVVDSGPALLDALRTVEDLHRRRSRLALYAGLRADLDARDEARREARRRADALAAEVREAVNAVRRGIARLPADRLEEYRRTTDGLGAFDRLLEDVRRRADHVRSAEVESTLATVADSLDAPARTIRRLRSEGFDPPTVDRPDGTSVAVTRGRLDAALCHPDRDYRRRAYEAYVGTLDGVATTLGGAIADRHRAAAARAEVREFDTVREMTLSGATYPETGLHASLPPTAHDAMLAGVRRNVGPHRRRLRRRRELLGVETLRPWDLRVPLAGRVGSAAEADDPGAELPYDRARDLIVDAVAPLGEAYRERLAALLDGRRVDAYGTARKGPAGHCVSSYDDGAFVLLDYRDDLASAFDLAHELGHAMHVELLREANRPLYATGPRPVEEVPSLLHELLLSDHLLDAAETPRLAARAGERLLSTLDGNLYNAARTSLATHECYRRLGGDGTGSDADALSLDRLTAVYDAGRAEFHAPVAYPEDDRYWLGFPHDRAPYHYYQYVLGAAGTLVVADRLREGALAPGAYVDVLRSTGRRGAVDAFDALGVDVTDPAAYERAAAAFAEYRERVAEERG